MPKLLGPVLQRPLETNSRRIHTMANSQGSTGSLSDDIHPADEMFLTAMNHCKDPLFARMAYFRQGSEANHLLQQIIKWKFGSPDAVRKVLDFACGYGRVTRYMARDLTPAKVWVSDIYREAVAFQQEAFGVQGFNSVTEPLTLERPERFDVIFVASLFTHLPEARFKDWLKVLVGLLSDDGVLAFSVHDESLAPPGTDIPDSGMLFLTQSESQSLDLNEYGSNFVTQAFVERALADALGAPWASRRVPRGLCDSHDIYLVTRNPRQDFTGFRYRPAAAGYVDVIDASRRDKVLRVSGWAADRAAPYTVESIGIYIDGELKARVAVNQARDDVAQVLGAPHWAKSGWSIRHPYQRTDSSSILEVRAMTQDGMETVFFVAKERDLPEAPDVADASRKKMGVAQRLLHRLGLS